MPYLPSQKALGKAVIMIRKSPISLLGILVEEVYRQVMKTPANGVNIHERQRMVVSAIREQNEHAFLDRIDPHTRSRKSKMSEALWRHFCSGGRIRRRGELEGERAVLVHSCREIGAKKLAGLRF